ncbi:MAG: phenylacetic acid degradation operon negative regulatory protein [Alteromonadaceae bacterium]
MNIETYDKFISTRSKQIKISGTSLIVTVFGDLITQHGNWIWLGSLIEALEPLGINERLVRTSVYRLVQNDWLIRKKIKKNSYYSLSEEAKRHYDRAALRIYNAEQSEWDGTWLLVLPVFVEEVKKEQLYKELTWLGFSPLSTGVWAHPSIAKDSLEDVLVQHDLLEQVIIFNSTTYQKTSQTTLKKLVQERWNLEQLSSDYQLILDAYRPLLLDVMEKDKPTPQQSFLLRTLFIHEFRRVLIKDHELPESMLPYDWPGFETVELAEKLYGLLADNSIDYVQAHLKNPQGNLPSVSRTFWLRFKKASLV